MDFFNMKKFLELSEINHDHCISMYIPTIRKGENTKQNAIRFKNALNKAKNELEQRDLREREISALLKPTDELINNSVFWSYQSDGLAVFITPDDFFYYRLPVEFEEMIFINDRFYLKPLISMLGSDGRYFLLALSQKEVKLYEGTQYTIKEIKLKNIPLSIEEALKYDDPEKHLQYHTGTGTGKGRRSAMFHGQGTGTDAAGQKKNILRFFQIVNKGIQEYLRDETSPLILAGVDFLIPIYMEANSYAHLIDSAVQSHPGDLSTEELHHRAWKAISPYFQRDREKAWTKFQENKQNDLASDDINKIIPAAYSGRVQYLFIPLRHQKWGSFDPESMSVEVHENRSQNDADLIDFAAMHTLRQKGAVYPVKPEEMPDKSEIAAVFRY
ncbi:hypothetical protein GF337_20020 [candidate division KSB1 bacterium]|nr:hypothetical protein [candidate division KSB1 bacterium]